MERRLQDLRRRMLSDPANQSARREWIQAVSRTQGPLTFLQDRLVWNDTPPELQDQANQTVALALGEQFKLVSTREYHCNESSHRIAQIQHVPTKISLHLIPGGTFEMGTAAERVLEETSYCREFDENYQGHLLEFEVPRHLVSVAPFLMAHTPLLTESWLIHGEAPTETQNSGADHPQTHLTPELVQAWLALAHPSFRLASEAEWEYACRAGTSSRYFWGEDMDEDYCWFYTNSDQSTHPMSEHEDKYNAFGLIDMIGNVWELCADSWIPNYHHGPHDQSPRLSSSDHPVHRGGGWSYTGGYMRCASRDHYDPHNRQNFDVGVRFCLDLPDRGIVST